MTNKGIIIAADFLDIEDFKNLVIVTSDLSGVVGYKIGFSLALTYGLPVLADVIKLYGSYGARIIYDHQKAGTDIPETGWKFATVLQKAGVKEVILFPLAGTVTARHWIRNCKDAGLRVLLGSLMTHHGFLTGDGGVIDPAVLLHLFTVGIEEGVTDFVVPGVTHSIVQFALLHKSIGYLRDNLESLSLYTPGIGAQGGSAKVFLTEANLRKTDKYYPIIGRAITEAKDMRTATLKVLEEM